MLLKWLALTLKMRHVHAILREIRPFKIRTPKGCRRIRRHSRNPVKHTSFYILLSLASSIVSILLQVYVLCLVTTALAAVATLCRIIGLVELM